MTFGRELVVLHTTPFHVSVSLRCMLGGSVEVRTKNILDRFVEGQTRFDMSRGAKLSLVLKEPK